MSLINPFFLSPLGAKFTPDGNTVYIADGALGLLRVVDPLNPKSKVEIVASKVMDGGKITPITFADDVTIGPKSGRVYFTDGKTNLLVGRLID
jgi:DNA-binding beta-propeller fold protein YncE